jgi:hypothetical protein
LPLHHGRRRLPSARQNHSRCLDHQYCGSSAAAAYPLPVKHSSTFLESGGTALDLDIIKIGVPILDGKRQLDPVNPSPLKTRAGFALAVIMLA